MPEPPVGLPPGAEAPPAGREASRRVRRRAFRRAVPRASGAC